MVSLCRYIWHIIFSCQAIPCQARWNPRLASSHILRPATLRLRHTTPASPTASRAGAYDSSDAAKRQPVQQLHHLVALGRCELLRRSLLPALSLSIFQHNCYLSAVRLTTAEPLLAFRRFPHQLIAKNQLAWLLRPPTAHSTCRPTLVRVSDIIWPPRRISC